MTANNKPINAWLPSLAESVTSCPCPPEVSEHIPDTDKAETDGGIFFCEFCELAQRDINYVCVGDNVCQCDGSCSQCEQVTAVIELNANDGFCDECHSHHDFVSRSYPKNSKDSILRHEVYLVNGCSQPFNLE